MLSICAMYSLCYKLSCVEFREQELNMKKELSPGTQKVYEHLKIKGKIGADTNELIVMCNTTRPSNAIVELRKLGYNVITEMRTNSNTR